MSDPSRTDHPGVLAPPPLIFGLPLLLGLIVHFSGAGLDFGLPLWLRLVLGLSALAAGIVPIALALLRFRRAGTSPEPWKPSTALVVDGVYRLTRNPMYLGMALVYAGIAILLDCAFTAALLVPAVLTIHFGVILREERYLTAKFGKPYRDFLRRSRRWL
ncbi:methyltransferase family protein [Jiella pacifica]|uniref:Isoprenylcysteine carboxylmethyltransferase family protein n=1 Tax=Jiella pacifica TaxID=2696469 RepID=A0A6N9T452_9HYPH|nr:isoprenylcysteine carboxylmethyltransferase family protein [Jiella pacifica]NDW03748.1 isoprenylcysteine carboxylmethyltransferase family protein [Jiella pacifica]